MKSKQLLILAALVAVLGGYILFFERHQQSKDERMESANKVLPGVDRDDIVAIDINNSFGEIRLEKRGDDWHLVAPIDFAADATAVGGLLTSLLGLEAERRFDAGEVDPADHGLAEPAMGVVLYSTGGVAYRIDVGSKSALGSTRAVSRGDGQVLICPGMFTSDLDRSLDDWRSRQVIDVFAGDVASLEVVAGDDRTHAVQRDGLWHLLEPVNDLADREHIRTLISNLNALKVEVFLDQGAGPAATDPVALGLEPPAYRVTVVRSDGGDPTVLELGTTREQNGTTQVACRRDGKDLLWVGDQALTSLGRAPVRWRSSVVYPFDSWDVQAVTFTRGETTVAAQRSGGIWYLADGSEADGSTLLDRLSRLSRLSVLELDLVEAGLPELGRIGVVLSGGSFAEEGDSSAGTTLTYTFLQPLRQGGDTLVRVNQRATLMSVETTEAEELLVDLDSLAATTETDEDAMAETDTEESQAETEEPDAPTAP